VRADVGGRGRYRVFNQVVLETGRETIFYRFDLVRRRGAVRLGTDANLV
jgi:hypothetical protein